MIVLQFLAWNLMLYGTHRLAHFWSVMWRFHKDHHDTVSCGGLTGPDIKNLLLWNDTWPSTIDLWLTEVLPTVAFSAVTGWWWLAVFYYLWAALVQEWIEHNPRFDIFPVLTSGKWHLIHHRWPDKNLSIITPFWDCVFSTAYAHHEKQLAANQSPRAPSLSGRAVLGQD